MTVYVAWLVGNFAAGAATLAFWRSSRPKTSIAEENNR